MSQSEDRLRSIKAKIERLRVRIKQSRADQALCAVLLGMLDLLEDEL